MEAKANYTIVGAVVLILSAGLLSVGLWLSVGFDQKDYGYYTVYMDEAVSGLSVQQPVKYNGVPVGFVKKIELSKYDPRKVALTLSIEQGTPITTSTVASLVSQGITGNSYVGLSATSANLTPLKKIPGEPYPVIPSKPSLFNELQTAIKNVAQNVNKVSDQIHKVFDDQNVKNITRSLINIERVTTTLSNNSNAIDSSIKHADIFLANMAKVSKDLPSVVAELKKGVDQFSEAALDVSQAGKKVSKTMDVGKNAIDKISQQTLPSFDILLQRIEAISANLEQISNQMRQNPSVVIRGTKPAKLGPGE